MIFKKLLLLFGLIRSNSGQNWCNIQSCQPKTHIACNNNGAFYTTCNNPVAVKFTSSQLKLILQGHNAYRNKVASGKLQGFSTARRMAKMIWNDQMAFLAELNTKQCKMVKALCFSMSFHKLNQFFL